jgi:hypothetical protein
VVGPDCAWAGEAPASRTASIRVASPASIGASFLTVTIRFHLSIFYSFLQLVLADYFDENKIIAEIASKTGNTGNAR